MAETQPQANDPAPPTTTTTGALYQSGNDALKAVRDDYLYWTGKLTDTSVQLSYAVVGANWAVFGTVDKILKNQWSQWSIGLVILGLLVNVAGAKWMGELHRRRIEYAEKDAERWEREFNETKGKIDPWPFSDGIESLGRLMREVRTWLPLVGGVLFLIALLRP